MPIQPALFGNVPGNRSLGEVAEVTATRSAFDDRHLEDSVTTVLGCADGEIAVDEHESHHAEDRAFLEAVGLAKDGDSPTYEGEAGR